MERVFLLDILEDAREEARHNKVCLDTTVLHPQIYQVKSQSKLVSIYEQDFNDLMEKREEQVYVYPSFRNYSKNIRYDLEYLSEQNPVITKKGEKDLKNFQRFLDGMPYEIGRRDLSLEMHNKLRDFYNNFNQGLDFIIEKARKKGWSDVSERARNVLNKNPLSELEEEYDFDNTEKELLGVLIEESTNQFTTLFTKRMKINDFLDDERFERRLEKYGYNPYNIGMYFISPVIEGIEMKA